MVVCSLEYESKIQGPQFHTIAIDSHGCYCTVLYCTETGAVSDLLYKYIKSTVSIQYSRQDPKITDDFTEQYSDNSFTESKNIVRTSVRSFVLIYSSKTEKKQLKNIFYISLCMI